MVKIMKKNDITNFIKILKEAYPDATCSLDFETPFQIVVAVMLSAQCNIFNKSCSIFSGPFSCERPILLETLFT